MRLFIALDLPADVRAEVARWRDAVLSGREGLRPAGDRALHLTLAFLGELEPSSLDTLSQVLNALAGSGRARLALGEPCWLPRGRPRVLGIAVEDDERVLRDTQAQLASLLRQRAGISPEARIFFPHITVARVRRGHKVRPAPLPGPEPVEFSATTVTLYESAGGYRPLHSIQL